MERKSITGFTLIELLIVIAILIVIIAVALPNIKGMLPDIRLKSAARDLVSNLQKLRMEAVKNNVPSTIVFDSTISPGRYFFDSNGNGVFNSGEYAIGFSGYKSGVDFGLGATGGNNWDTPSVACTQAAFITFTSRGTANSGTVYIDNRNNDTCYAVTVLTTGSINIRQFTGTQWK